MPNNLLVTGPPRAGKTTFIRDLATRLEDLNPAGFYTAEIRDGGNRVGFELVSFDGQREILSHTSFKGRFRVGKYGVDVRAFEQFLKRIPIFMQGSRIIIIDEIGKMECHSAQFKEMILEILDSDIPCVATIAQKGTPFIEMLKTRTDVFQIEMTKDRRPEILREVLLILSDMGVIG